MIVNLYDHARRSMEAPPSRPSTSGRARSSSMASRGEQGASKPSRTSSDGGIPGVPKLTRLREAQMGNGGFRPFSARNRLQTVPSQVSQHTICYNAHLSHSRTHLNPSLLPGELSHAHAQSMRVTTEDASLLKNFCFDDHARWFPHCCHPDSRAAPVTGNHEFSLFPAPPPPPLLPFPL